MAAPYNVYVAIDSNNEQRYLFVPNYNNTTPFNYANGKVYTSVDRVLSEHPDFIFEETIFIRTNAAKNNLLSLGFVNVVSFEEENGNRWTFADGSYITFTQNSFSAYKNNTFYLSRSAGTAVANGFLTDTLFNNGTYNGYNYYLSISDISSGSFKLYRYPEYINSNITNFFENIPPYVVPTDPYEQGGTSTTGGGTGTFTLDSDAINVPNPPTLSAVDTGLVSLYAPTLTQLQSLANYLWNADATTVDWWKKLIANPLDLILGLSIVPVAVPTSGAVSVKVGLIDTQIQMNKASSQYVQVDCGTLNVVEFYGAALDYLPFRKTSIYLPFIGTRTISTDDIMGKALQVVYNIDLLSGALTAMIKCGDAVLYQYSGSCAMSIPLTGQTFTDMITSTIQLAAGIGATVASGGAAAGVVAANAANSVMSMKPTVERAGGVSGAAGQLAIMKPYLIGEIPRQSVPENYNKFAGYPSNIKATLSDLSGYTEIETVYLEGIAATDSELNEIETLLKGGVFL